MPPQGPWDNYAPQQQPGTPPPGPWMNYAPQTEEDENKDLAAKQGKQIDEQNKERSEGLGSKMLGTVGRQLEGIVSSAYEPIKAGYGTYEQNRSQGKGIGESVLRGAGTMEAHQIKNVAQMNPISEAMQYAPIASGEEYKREQGRGTSKIYSALAPVGAQLTGINLLRMEHEADIGAPKGVLAEAAVPAIETAAGYASSIPALREGAAEIAEPFRAAREQHRIAGGQSNIETALATPAGKGGERAANMKQDLQVATGDLAEIEKEMPSKTSSLLTRRRGQGAESFQDIADRIDSRMDDIWQKGHEPGISRHPDAALDGKNGNGDIGKALSAGQSAIPEMAERANPTEAAAAQKWLEEQNKPTTLKQADDLIREINDDLKSKSKGEQINPYGKVGVRVRNAFVKALRAQVDQTLENSGEQGVREINRRYGALGNIRDRLIERAVQLGLQESKEGVVPKWLHAYLFLHPEAAIPAVGVGVAFNRIAPSASTRLTRGMRQLGNTTLSAPYESVAPPNWRPEVETNPSRMLPSAPIQLRSSQEPITPAENNFQGPLPQDFASTRAQRTGRLLPRGAIQLGSSMEPLGQTQYTPIESGNAASVVQRNANSGRMQRLYTTSVEPPPLEGQTSETKMYREGPPLKSVLKAVSKSRPHLAPDQIKEYNRILDDPTETGVRKLEAIHALKDDAPRYPKKQAQQVRAQEGARSKGVKGGSQNVEAGTQPKIRFTTDKNGTRWATAEDGVKVSLKGPTSRSEAEALLEQQRQAQAEIRKRFSGGQK